MQIHVQGDCPEGIVLINPAFFEKMDEDILTVVQDNNAKGGKCIR